MRKWAKGCTSTFRQAHYGWLNATQCGARSVARGEQVMKIAAVAVAAAGWMNESEKVRKRESGRWGEGASGR